MQHRLQGNLVTAPSPPDTGAMTQPTPSAKTGIQCASCQISTEEEFGVFIPVSSTSHVTDCQDGDTSHVWWHWSIRQRERLQLPESDLIHSSVKFVIPFGGGYMTLFEIESADSIVIATVRHQREDDYH